MPMIGRPLPWMLCAGIVMAVATLARSAGAHAIGLSRGEYTVVGTSVRAELTLRADDAALAVPGLDADGDGKVSEVELASGRALVEAVFMGRLAVSSDGETCTAAQPGDVALDPPDGVRVSADFACPRAPQRLRLQFGFLDVLPAGHRHLATVHAGGQSFEELAVLSRPDVELDLGDSAPQRGWPSLLRAGVEHILTGYDHLAFVAALVLGGTLVMGRGAVKVGPLVAMLTAFTVGHSASLAVATLGGVAPGPRPVEAAVALSVAYVGAENLFTKSDRHRWMLTLPFGFVHGFALAGGLIDLGIPRARLAGALLAFNAGVETGQLALLAVLLPLLLLVRVRARWYPMAARIASGAIALAGATWFVQRVA